MSFNILVVDNGTEIFLELKDFVEKSIEQTNIIFSPNSLEALERFKKEKIDFLLAETNMPDMNGIELIEEAKISADNPELMSILMSEIPAEEEINKAYDLGVLDFLQKPLNLRKLLNIIKHHKAALDMENDLQKEKELVNTVMNTAQSPIFIHNGENIIFANLNFLELTGYKDHEELNKNIKNIQDLFLDNNVKAFREKSSLKWLQKHSGDNTTTISIKEKSGKYRYFSLAISFINERGLYTAVLSDITNEIEHEHELQALLYTENLTQLPNRSKLIEDLQTPGNKITSIAIIDINSFKEINDFYGHKIGDFILKGVADLILENINFSKGLRLYKFPSDTYCIVNIQLSQKKFTDTVKTIIEKIEKKVFIRDSHEIDTRATAGISFSTKNNKLITADLALQAAKKDHKDYLVFYDELDNLQEYEKNMLWTKKLKTALQKDDIIVYFQPLINNHSMKIEKYECLVRMIDGEKVVSPFFFLDISKKSNQYTKITKIVIEKSFKEFENLPFEFSVNVSYEDIEDEGFLDFIKEKLELYKVNKKVVFEILEDENIKNYDILIDFVSEIKKLGCKVALDDFGSGYSNFEHLLKMDIDYLKIDASLVKNIASDENSLKVTKTIIEFAKSLNLKTIAEYVENENIFKIIKDMGADYSQGYYFSAPIEAPNLYNTCQVEK